MIFSFFNVYKARQSRERLKTSRQAARKAPQPAGVKSGVAAPVPEVCGGILPSLHSLRILARSFSFGNSCPRHFVPAGSVASSKARAVSKPRAMVMEESKTHIRILKADRQSRVHPKV